MQKSLGRAIFECTCPKCRSGKMFEKSLTEGWYHRKMHDQCLECGQTFEPEPGFYFGAMFVSYAFSVAITFVCVFILYIFFEDPGIWVYMTVITAAVLLLWPVMYRYSRSIFLHLFGGIRYNSNIKK